MKNSIILTGASGFLGRTIHSNLPEGIISLGRGKGNDIRCDLSKSLPKLPPPSTIIHNAGKAHSIPRTPFEIETFFAVNYQGTLNLLSSLEKTPPQQFIFISTVAVYGLDNGELIDEQSPLNGKTPYAESKILAEKAVVEWCEKWNVNWVILRLPLVVGVNPPGNLGAIIKAINRGRYVSISGNHSKKSAVLAEDIAQLIPKLDGVKGIYNLTDSQHPTFNAIEEAIAEGLQKNIRWKLPLKILKFGAKLGDLVDRIGLPFPLTSNRLGKITSTLTFSDEKAQKELGWSPNPIIPYLKQGLFF